MICYFSRYSVIYNHILLHWKYTAAAISTEHTRVTNTDIHLLIPLFQ